MGIHLERATLCLRFGNSRCETHGQELSLDLMPKCEDFFIPSQLNNKSFSFDPISNPTTLHWHFLSFPVSRRDVVPRRQVRPTRWKQQVPDLPMLASTVDTCSAD